MPVSEEYTPSKTAKWIERLFFILGFLEIILVVHVFIGRGHLFVIVRGNSMQPTLYDKEWCFYAGKKIEQGTIICFNTESYDGTLIKRVIAVPGDTVDIGADGVFVNGEKLEETYLAPGADNTKGRIHHVTLEEGRYFAMGDNRSDSYDCRYFGPVEAGEISATASKTVTGAFVLNMILVILSGIAGFYISLAGEKLGRRYDRRRGNISV